MNKEIKEKCPHCGQIGCWHSKRNHDFSCQSIPSGSIYCCKCNFPQYLMPKISNLNKDISKEEQKKRIKEIREAKNVFPIFSTYPKWYKDPVIYLYGIPLILGFICIIIFCR